MKRSYVQIDGVLYEKGTEPRKTSSGLGGPTVIGDQPDFVSPIDGKLYSGRVGMREHNLRHSVVNNRDLAGLPTLTTASSLRSEQDKRQDRAARKELIIKQVMGH